VFFVVSIDDLLGEFLTILGGDMNLDTLLEQADTLLDLAMVRETDSGGNT
jgi:hypothetical protein